MKNIVVAIREGDTTCRFYVVIDTDIATGKAYVYNPETGYTVVNTLDRDVFTTNYIRKHPFEWMIEFNPTEVEAPENWVEEMIS